MSESDWVVKMKLLEDKLADFSYKCVKQEELPDGKFVSTVWLGLDYSYFGEAHGPLIFETMVFPKRGEFGELDMDRYSTEEEALIGHAEMVKKWLEKTGE